MSDPALRTSLHVDCQDRKKHASRILKQLDTTKAVYIDLRFTDLNGVWHHMSIHADAVDESLLSLGVMFDGSSIQGWKPIHESDMLLLPDSNSAVLDQFSDYPTLIIFCNVVDPLTGKSYNRDPRSIAVKAHDYMLQTGIADEVRFGPEPEFFIFDEIHFENSAANSFYAINMCEGPYPNSDLFQHKHGNLRHHGHRPQSGRGYFPVSPVDSAQELRGDMVAKLISMGIKCDKHHHEVAPGQHEIGFKYGGLVDTGDNLQLFKYVVRNVAHQAGKTATFMPKPIFGENGSGMHVHQSLWKDDQTLFAGDKYANLSENALYYIGGIMKHSQALNAFTNPTTNSYKRLVPGYEAPVHIAYSAKNRSAAVRIPHVPLASHKRIEVRYPDATSNTYLALSAMLMAGLDGIQNKIHPGEAQDQNLYNAGGTDQGILSTSLQDALRSLQDDKDFLLKGDVFTNDMIESYIALKQEEIHSFMRAPHPVEFEMYYSL